jgi:hypothetical protein
MFAGLIGFSGSEIISTFVAAASFVANAALILGRRNGRQLKWFSLLPKA